MAAVASGMRFVIAAGCVAAMFFGIYQFTRARTEAPSPAQLAPARPTFDLTAADLIGRYNSAASNMGQEMPMALPPESGMKRATGSNSFYSLRHDLASHVSLVIEVDEQKKKPFSINVWGGSEADPYKAMHLVGVMAAAGVAIFGRGEDSTAMADVCSQAAQEASQRASLSKHGLEVSCSAVNGLWLGSISVPRPAPPSH